MIIGVKGTDRQDRPGDPAVRYELKNQDRKSSAPFVIGLFLTGIVVYLKSMMPLFSRSESKDSVSDNKPAAPPPEPQAALSAALQEQEAEEEAEPEEQHPMGSGGQLVDLLPPADFILVDSSAIEFAAYETPSAWGGLPIPPLVSLAANDNMVALPARSKPPGRHDGHEGTDTSTPDTSDPDNQGSGDTDNGDNDTDEDEQDGGDGDADEDSDDDTSQNRAPRVSGPVYLNDVSGCAVLAIAMSELLRNAQDPDGDTLSVQNLTVSSGTLLASDEGWLFRGWPATEGLVTVSYQVTDGEFSVDQVAYFSVIESFIEGSPADDLILGTPCADEIEAGDGNDNVDARGGADLVSGGSGDDHIVAGGGADVVHAGPGDDIVFGGWGDDHLAGGSGNDRLYGEGGDDLIFGGAGHDIVEGGIGRDILHGDDGYDSLEGGDDDDILLAGAGDDIADGGGGADLLDGGEGDDRLQGGEGDDVLLDGTGADEVDGGEGDDRAVPAQDDTADRFDGGQGHDTVDYSSLQEGVSVDLENGFAAVDGAAADRLTSFETALGGAGDDELRGSAADEGLSGGAGNDVLVGMGGQDRLSGGSGDDVIDDGAGSDLVEAGDGNDRIAAAADGDDDHYGGGEGCDTLDYSQTSQGVTVDLQEGVACGEETGRDTIDSVEQVIGGDGDDHFIAGQASAALTGGHGEDIFEFSYAPPSPHSETSHLIFDFTVGDRIRMSKYDLFERVMDEVEDHFEEIYGEQSDDDLLIRFSHDRTDEMARTIVEADLNDDTVWETTIYLHGHHVLMIVEHA